MSGFILMSFLAMSGLIAIFSSVLADELDDSKQSTFSYFIGNRALAWPWIACSFLLGQFSLKQLIIYNSVTFHDGYWPILISEVIAALSIMLSALIVLPRYWSFGMISLPEFIEQRFDRGTRKLSSVLFLSAYILVLLPLTLLMGAWIFRSIFDLSISIEYISLGVGLLGGWYALRGFNTITLSDGIYSVALLLISLALPTWALMDLGDGSLTAGMTQGFNEVFNGTSERLQSDSKPGFNPNPHSNSWDTLCTGMIVFQLFLWSSHQVTMQRVLGAKTLADGQKAMFLSALIKLISPLLLCLPAFIAWRFLGELSVVLNPDSLQEALNFDEHSKTEAFHLAQNILDSGASRISLETAEMLRPLGLSFGDQVYAAVLRRLVPEWSLGLIAATLLGLIISTYNSILHSASTLFVFEFNGGSCQYIKGTDLQRTAKVTTCTLSIISIFLALILSRLDSILVYLQMINGVWSVPLASVFFIALVNQTAPASFAKLAIGITLSLYLILSFQPLFALHWLHIYFICFLVAVVFLLLGARFKPKAIPSSVISGPVLTNGSQDLPWRYARQATFVLVTIILFIVGMQLL